MSEIVSVQIGQCGNQATIYIIRLGWYQFLNKDVLYVFSATKNIARAVLIDMEPKVIAATMQTAKKGGLWCYDDSQYFWRQSGSANNWAYGYNTHAPTAAESVTALVRKEVELCDNFGGFFSTLSLAGGTGSGTYITEMLRDDYPHSFNVVQPVWPFETGEVIVQNYNAVLSLSHLYETCDAIVAMENDQLHAVCTRLLNIKKVSFTDMNKVIAQSLVGALLPSFQKTGRRLSLFSDPIAHLCSHPDYKLLNIKAVPMISKAAIPFSTYVWTGQVKRLYQMHITNAKIDEGLDWTVKAEDARVDKGAQRWQLNKSVANLLILRGSDTSKVEYSQLENQDIYANWTSDPLMVCHHPKSFCSHEKTATLMSNSQALVVPLNKIVAKAYEMYLSRAFLHQYQQHGIEQLHFEDSFVLLERVIKAYQNL